jgi:hypothetical protein
MSIYIMTVGELAKKRGEPVGEFVKKVQELGFEAGSHAKKLTQGDLDVLIAMLDGSHGKSSTAPKETVPERVLKNPNVLLITRNDGKKEIMVVDAHLNSAGQLVVETVSQSTESSLGEGLLEFRKQLGMRMGIN